MRLFPSLILLPLLSLAAAAPAGERDLGPGIAGERQGDALTYRVGGFDRIAVGTAGAADVRVGPQWSLRIAGPAAALANLRVVLERGRLEVGRRHTGRDTSASERQLRIAITLPRISEASLGGSGSMAIDRVDGGRFAVAVGGSGDLRIGRMAVEDATVSIGGSGTVAAAGTTRALTVNLGGSGGLDARGLRAGTATVAAAGSGSVRARVDGPASVTLVGSGAVDLGPDARCQVTRRGSGRVTCGR